MAKYSIKELETLSGIKAHTIRIWEQRYGLLIPKRTDTNIRLYDDEELKYLLNISLLNKNGFKISKLSKQSKKEVSEQVLKLTETSHSYENQVESLVLTMVTFNEDGFEKILTTNILRIGFENTFVHIIFPFLIKIGVLWQAGSIRPAQEHFVSNLIRQKIIVALDGQFTPPNKNPKKVLLFLAEKERHELSLLFSNYLFRSRGCKTLYLGTDVPFDDVIESCKDYNPDFVFSVATASPTSDEIVDYVKELKAKANNTQVVLTGKQAIDKYSELKNIIKVLKTIDESVEWVSTLNAPSS